MTRLMGVDGCRGGWLAVIWDLRKQALVCAAVPRWCDLDHGAAAVTAVDMPIGLTDVGPRDCDILARRRLPPGRKSSVFPAPRRYMLDCTTWREAQDLGRAREGKGLSKQAWNLVAKIREIDRSIAPADQSVLHEAHPELVFLHLNAGSPLPSKRKPDGFELRRKLLHSAGLAGIDAWLDRFPRSCAGRDDILDAAACAYAARRIWSGEAVSLPARPPRDARGLSMEIWY